MMNAELESAIGELNRTFGLPVYEAFDVAWIAVLKIANLLPGREEDDRLLELLGRIPQDTVRHVLNRQEVDTLLNLQPPLETILSSRHERLNAERTGLELAMVRIHRNDDPKTAMGNLARVLKRIRNRRAHGFKTPEAPRDNEILGSALWILRLIGLSAAEALAGGGSTDEREARLSSC
jgi:hypothetical protein